MIGLKRVIFVNTGRFLYGDVDVSGNTLLTGTNGAGKTTTMQAVLFFYGSSKGDRLGIQRGEGKNNWLKYSYPYLNSYLFYEYEGVHGKMLLMTYANGTQINYRFIALTQEIDLKSIVLNDGKTINEREKVLSNFVTRGLKPTTQISSPSRFREVLYGGSALKNDKTLREFREFALMQAEGNYNLIHDVQSSIFLSSRVESGAFENAIANSFGSDVQIDISYIREQLQDSMGDYEAIKIYESGRKLTEEIFKKHSEILSTQESLVEAIKQIVLHNNYNLNYLPKYREDAESIAKKNEDTKVQNREKSDSLGAQRDASRSEFELSRGELKRAEELRDKYDETIGERVDLVESIPLLEANFENANSNYFSLVGEQKSVAERYENQLIAAKTHSGSQKQTLLDIYQKKAEEIKEEMALKEALYESNMQSIQEETLRAQNIADKVAQDSFELKTEAQAKCSFIKSHNPFVEQIGRVTKDIESKSSLLQSKESELRHKRDRLASVEEHRGSTQERILEADTVAQERYLLRKEPYEKEIKSLERLLHVSEDTLLYYIRENLSQNEATLTALLKDEVLYSKILEPQVVVDAKSLYGLEINTQNLEESQYSHANISAKIKEQKEHIATIKLEIDTQLLAKKEELKKVELHLQKEHFLLNKDEAQLQIEISKLNAKIIRLKGELYNETTLSEQKWQEAVGEADALLSVAEAKYLGDKHKREKLRVSTQESLNRARESHREYKRAKEHELQMQQEQKAKELRDFDSALEIEIKEIQKNRTAALLEGGVSQEELLRAEALREEAKIALSRAKSYSDLVAVWRSDKKIFENIPALRELLLEKKALYESDDKQLKEQTQAMKEEEQSLQKRVNSAFKRVAEIEEAIDKTAEEFSSTEYKEYLHEYKMLEIKEMLESEDLNAIFAKVARVLKKKQEYFFSLEKSLDKFMSKFSNDKYIWFTYKNTTESELLSSAQSLQLFLKGGGIEQTKELLAKSIRGIQNNISDRYLRLNTQSEKISASIEKISKRLGAAVANIPVLDDIGLRYVRSENRILAQLGAISEIDIPYGDANSLFAEPTKSSKSTHLILEKYEKLLEYLSTEKAQVITVADTFEVELKAVENGNSTQWIKARKQIGSEGTSVIVKTLLYVAMLDTVLSMTRKNTQANMHVLLDEIGKIDQRNMREVITFANNSGILFLNAAPDVKIPTFYKAIYHYKIINGKTKIILGAIRE